MTDGLKKLRDIGTDELGKIFSEATLGAAQASLAAGVSIAGLDHETGGVIYSHPDGTISPFPCGGGPKGST